MMFERSGQAYRLRYNTKQDAPSPVPFSRPYSQEDLNNEADDADCHIRKKKPENGRRSPLNGSWRTVKNPLSQPPLHRTGHLLKCQELEQKD